MDLMLFPPSWYGEHPDYYRNDDPPECPRCGDQVDELVDGLCPVCDDDLEAGAASQQLSVNDGAAA